VLCFSFLSSVAPLPRPPGDDAPHSMKLADAMVGTLLSCVDQPPNGEGRFRGSRRLRLLTVDRLLWVWLYRLWPRCLEVMVLVKPVTVVQWHRQGFRLFWRWRSRSGRPSVDREVSKLIREMSRSNPLWGAPQSMASCSSSASRSVKLRLPSTWCEEATMTNLTPRVTWTNILSTANVGRYRECRMLSFLLSGSFWGRSLCSRLHLA